MAKRGNGEGSIYKDKDGRWRASVHLGYQGGKRIRKTLSGRTRGEVADKLAKALRDHKDGLPVKVERQTVGQYLDRWLQESVKRRVRYSTHDSYARMVRDHIKPELGRIQLAKLSAPQVESFLNVKLMGGLSPRTVQYLHAILRSALTQATKWGLVPRNVVKLVDAPRPNRPEVQPLSPAQALQFLAAVRGHRLEALYSVALAVGLRQGEALALEWKDVDLERSTLTVRATLQRVDGKLVRLEPKTARSRRTVHLPGVAVEALRQHRERQAEERQLAGTRWVERGLVFPSTIGTPQDARNVVRHFHQTLDLLGFPRQRYHDLRHTCASLLLAQGVHARTVMEVLGHSQISLTMDTYSHLMPSVMRDAATRMDAVLGGVASSVASTPKHEQVN